MNRKFEFSALWHLRKLRFSENVMWMWTYFKTEYGRFFFILAPSVPNTCIIIRLFVNFMIRLPVRRSFNLSKPLFFKHLYFFVKKNRKWKNAVDSSNLYNTMNLLTAPFFDSQLSQPICSSWINAMNIFLK